MYFDVFAFTLPRMKRFLAYIFLAIFSFQVLPVKELGKILFKGQMTEEVHENCNIESDDCPDSKVKKEGDPSKFLYTHQQNIAIELHINAIVHAAVLNTGNLPSHFVPDIATPPPNYKA